MYYLFSLIPILLYLMLLVILDSFALVKKISIATAIVYGILVCVATFLLSMDINEMGWIIPIFEEILKGMLVLLLISNRKIIFFAEALILGAATGAGFALAENIAYLYFLAEEITPFTAIYRGLGTALMHMGVTGIGGVILLLISENYYRFRKDALSELYVLKGFFLVALVLPVTLHLLFNYYLLQLAPAISLIIVIVSILIVFMILFKINETHVHNYLETSLFTNVELMQFIKKGQLAETNCGKYLLSIKQQFRQDVFLDMLCYLQVSLQLAMIRKREIILAEMEMTMPKDPVREKEEKALRLELLCLEKNIGKTGKMIIKPLGH